jgi:hypothetical protein
LKENALIHRTLAAAVAAATLHVTMMVAAADGATVQPTKAVTVLDSVRIPWGFRLSELSGLAWDQDEQLLYAVSDLGHLVHFKVEIKDDKIASVEPVFFGPLALAVGQEKFSDTEDLVAINSANGKKGDTELAVVFEDGPAAARFTDRGELIAPIALPAQLLDRSAYRQVNQRLESIAMLPNGSFLFGPQTPLKTDKRSRHTLYASDGRQWSYKAYQKKGSSTKALQFLPDGSLLILEAENDQGFLASIGLGGKDARLRRLDIASCVDVKKCDVVDYPIAGDPIRGRFEGITNISGDLYLMVTDETFGAELMLVRLAAASQ